MHRLVGSLFVSLLLSAAVATAAEPATAPPPRVASESAQSWICLPAKGYAFTHCDKMCSSSEAELAACKERERQKKPALTRFRIDGSSWRPLSAGQATCVPVKTGSRVRVALEGEDSFVVRPAASCATREYRVWKAPCGWAADCAKKPAAKALRLAD